MLRSRFRDVFRVSASLVTSMQFSGLFQSACRSEYALNVTFLLNSSFLGSFAS
jgi:hypothetical protein